MKEEIKSSGPQLHKNFHLKPSFDWLLKQLNDVAMVVNIDGKVTISDKCYGTRALKCDILDNLGEGEMNGIIIDIYKLSTVS